MTENAADLPLIALAVFPVYTCLINSIIILSWLMFFVLAEYEQDSTDLSEVLS